MFKLVKLLLAVAATNATCEQFLLQWNTFIKPFLETTELGIG